MEQRIVLGNIDRQEALRYLGYGHASADDRVQGLLDECEKEVLEKAEPRYVYRVFDIESVPEGISVKGTNLVLKGKSIRQHLENCKQAVLMAVTISESIDRLIRITKITDMAKTLVMDSVASVAVEQACNKTEELIKASYPDFYQTFRFGLGYGDLPIQLQADFLKVLNAQKLIGLNVSDSSMLIPTKSVTAVIGLSQQEITGQARGCQTCNLKDRCKFREKGGHCYA